LAFCGLGLALPAIIAVALLVVPRIAYAGNAKLRDPYQLTFSDKGIRFETTSIDSSLAWGLYTRVTEVRGFYLLYWGRREFTVIPKRAFETAADMQAFEALLVAHVAKIDRRM
jgi:YcxB-like protein